MPYYSGKLILFLLVVPATIMSQPLSRSFDYGLRFASHEVSKDHRTSLNLNPQGPFTFEKDFELQFDISFQRMTKAYGYILRIIADDSLNIDLLSSPSHNEFHDLNLIINNSQTRIHYDFPELELEVHKWSRLIVAFSRKMHQISFSWNGITKTQDIPLSKLRTFRFYFGANDFGKFSTKDVPPIAIRDVRILRDKKVFKSWPLKQHRVDAVYDSVSQAKAAVTNAAWLIDNHTRWVHLKEFVVGKYPSVAFNSQSGILYAIDKKNVYTLNVQHGELVTSPHLQGSPVNTNANQLIYVPEDSRLINYDLKKNILSHYNFRERTWQNTDTLYSEPDYWHQNKFYNKYNNSLYVFGGYGHFSYKNGFFRHDNASGKWTEVKTTGSIPPRYLGALGAADNGKKVYIFGGYGSLSGKQELSPQPFYDFYSFDLKTHRIDKLWQIPSARSSGDEVFSNSLVVNEADSCFYVLGFPKNKYESLIRLKKYRLESPEAEVLADSIPFRFHDEDAFCDLFFSAPTRKLVAVTAHKENEQFKINVYSINYPPLRAADVLQIPATQESYAAGQGIIIFAIIITMSGCFYLFIRKRRKRGKPADATPAISTSTDVDPVRTTKRDEILSTINLFGGFQVIDHQGRDITAQFTTTLRELFVLILLHSIRYEKGISTAELQEHLWPDKDEASARNNRNVNIKKLRMLLAEIGDVTITNNNSYLQLSVGENVHCDYRTVFEMLNSTSTAANRSPDEIQTILKQIKKGSLLPNLQSSWLDPFKSDISNRLIDALLEYSERLDIRKDDKILIEIADSIFNYDSINQEALVIKCSVLNRKGKYSLAKVWYEHFVREYETLYSEKYPRTFEEVIS